MSITEQKEVLGDDLENISFNRLDNESAEAFNAFCLYRDTRDDNGRRSVNAAYRKYKNSTDRNMTANGTWNDWREKFKWIERVKEYDRYMSRASEVAKQKALDKEAEEWANRRRAQREEEWELSQELLKKARAMLAFPITQKTIQEDGKTVTIAPAKWTMSDVPKVVDIATKLSRSATETPQIDLAQTEGGGDAKTVPAVGKINEMSEEEIDALIEEFEESKTPAALPAGPVLFHPQEP
jgi:hypothetical protein